MKSCRSTLIARGGVLVLSAAAVGPVTAQTTSAVLDEIVVTARRVEESLQKVPVAVSALSGETLQQRAVVAVDDIMRSVPSVNFGTGTRSSSTPFFGIRGINSSDLVGALDPAVGIYQNEVIMQRPNGVLSSLYDVQSVQVLRGPQGTLFGRNTVGGAILVTSRKPEEEFGGYITGSYGDFDYLNFEGAVNIPLADWAQLRVAGRMVDRDGYVKSDITGQDQSNLGSDAYRVTLALQPTEAISSITYYDWFKQDTNGVGAVSRGLIPPGTFIGSGVVNVNSNVSDAGNRGAIANAGTVGRDDFYRNLSNEDQEDYTKAWNLSNTTTIKLNETFSVKNIVGYRDVDYHSSVDLDSSIGRILTVGTENSTHQVSEELQFLGRWDKFDFIVGGYYFREKGTDVAPSYTFIPLASVNNPASQGRTGAEVENKSYSLFGEGHLSVTDKLKLSFGLRGTKDDRQIILKSGNVSQPLGANPIFTCAVGNTTSVVPGAGPNGETVITTAPANPCELEKDKKFDELTWSVSADYQVTDDLLVYLAHRKGYHSGAFNQRATFDLPNDYAEPEILYDVEAGLKSDFDVGQMRARANIAAYYGWFDDIQRTLSLPTVILNGVARIPAGIGNAAEARIYGIETEFTLLPVSNLELSGFYAYNHTEYREWFDNSVPPAGRDRSDYPFPYAPVHTGGLTARYTVPLSGDFGTLVLQGNFYTTSAIKVTNPTMYAEPPSQYGRIGGYSLTNFRLELNDIASAPIDLALWVNNAFDKEYLVGSAIVASVGSAVYFPGPPRIYGFDLKYRFGGNGR